MRKALSTKKTEVNTRVMRKALSTKKTEGDHIVITTSGTYTWSLIAHKFRDQSPGGDCKTFRVIYVCSVINE